MSLFLYRGVSGEFMYFAGSSLAKTRPPNPTIFPEAFQIGNMILDRKRSKNSELECPNNPDFSNTSLSKSLDLIVLNKNFELSGANPILKNLIDSIEIPRSVKYFKAFPPLLDRSVS